MRKLQILLVIFSIISASLFFNVNHDNVFGQQSTTTPELPAIIELNKDYKEVIDTLYTYHPNLEQWQIDFAFDWLNAKCLQQFEKPNVLTEISCTAMNSGILSGTLEDWGYTFVSPTPTGKGPQLINQSTTLDNSLQQ